MANQNEKHDEQARDDQNVEDLTLEERDTENIAGGIKPARDGGPAR